MATMTRRLAVALLALLAGCARTRSPNLTVSVAASLENPMTDLAARYSAAHVDLNFGGSGALAQQIARGAPADLFFSASSRSMDDLSKHNLILGGTRHDLLRNEIVLIAPSRSGVNSFDALAGPGVKLVALGDPDSVPAGEYGRETLVSMHLWDRVQSKLVLAKDVRQVLTYVETGNADAGIVYATDARTSQAVKVVTVAPPESHGPVLYSVAVVRTTRDPDAARAFAAYLAGPEARAVFEASGFSVATP
jgi:molybdate transport system substrate-binding protein